VDGLHRFSFSGGGAVCDSCRVEGSVRLRQGLTEYLDALARAEMSALPPADSLLSGEAMGVARRFVEYHLDRKLISLAVLE
jgi:DNA repair protein RecO (recombination protein O)